MEYLLPEYLEMFSPELKTPERKSGRGETESSSKEETTERTSGEKNECEMEIINTDNTETTECNKLPRYKGPVVENVGIGGEEGGGYPPLLGYVPVNTVQLHFQQPPQKTFISDLDLGVSHLGAKKKGRIPRGFGEDFKARIRGILGTEGEALDTTYLKKSNSGLSSNTSSRSNSPPLRGGSEHGEPMNVRGMHKTIQVGKGLELSSNWGNFIPGGGIQRNKLRASGKLSDRQRVTSNYMVSLPDVAQRTYVDTSANTTGRRADMDNRNRGHVNPPLTPNQLKHIKMNCKLRGRRSGQVENIGKSFDKYENKHENEYIDGPESPLPIVLGYLGTPSSPHLKRIKMVKQQRMQRQLIRDKAEKSRNKSSSPFKTELQSRPRTKLEDAKLFRGDFQNVFGRKHTLKEFYNLSVKPKFTSPDQLTTGKTFHIPPNPELGLHLIRKSKYLAREKTRSPFVNLKAKLQDLYEQEKVSEEAQKKHEEFINYILEKVNLNPNSQASFDEKMFDVTARQNEIYEDRLFGLYHPGERRKKKKMGYIAKTINVEDEGSSPREEESSGNNTDLPPISSVRVGIDNNLTTLDINLKNTDAVEHSGSLFKGKANISPALFRIFDSKIIPPNTEYSALNSQGDSSIKRSRSRHMAETKLVKASMKYSISPSRMKLEKLRVAAKQRRIVNQNYGKWYLRPREFIRKVHPKQGFNIDKEIINMTTINQ